MRLTLKICTLPLLAGLVGAMIACSEGTTAAPGTGDGGETSTGSGGSSGTATTGSGGTAGATGTGAAGTTTYIKCFDFAESTEGWAKNYASVFTLADKTVRDEAASTALLADSSAEWMATAGYGGLTGFVQISMPFRTEQVEFQGLLYSYLPATGMALSGKTIHAFVKLVSGMTADDPSKPSGAKLVVKSGAGYFYADGGWVNLAKNDWKELMLTVDAPANYDLSKPKADFDSNDIREISVEFDTSGSATTVVSPGVVILDKVCY